MAKGGDKKQRRTPQLVDHVSDSSDDDEIDEDEAFNSEDERKYGALFAPKKSSSRKRNAKSDDSSSSSSSSDDDSSHSSSSSSSSDGIASDDDASEGDGGQYMLDLLSNLDNETESSQKDRSASTRAAAAHYSTNTHAESEFPGSAPTPIDDGGALTMDQLMGGIAGTTGYASVQKSLAGLTPQSADVRGKGGKGGMPPHRGGW